MKSTRLLAFALAGMMASMGTAALQVMNRAHLPNPLKPPKTIAPSRTVGSSRNGGHRGGNRMAQRAAMKRRNVLRNRAAHRG